MIKRIDNVEIANVRGIENAIFNVDSSRTNPRS